MSVSVIFCSCTRCAVSDDVRERECVRYRLINNIVRVSVFFCSFTRVAVSDDVRERGCVRWRLIDRQW